MNFSEGFSLDWDLDFELLLFNGDFANSYLVFAYLILRLSTIFICYLFFWFLSNLMVWDLEWPKWLPYFCRIPYGTNYYYNFCGLTLSKLTWFPAKLELLKLINWFESKMPNLATCYFLAFKFEFVWGFRFVLWEWFDIYFLLVLNLFRLFIGGLLDEDWSNSLWTTFIRESRFWDLSLLSEDLLVLYLPSNIDIGFFSRTAFLWFLVLRLVLEMPEDDNPLNFCPVLLF